jgi:DedD protein
MALAFWRRKNSAARTTQRRASATHSGDQTVGRVEPADIVRVRARRRLIGAAALLLTVAIVVPMVLDPEPKPVSDNIAIDIPSEKTPFTPRLTLPPVPSPENVPVAPPPEVAPPAEKVDELPAKAVEGKKVEEQRARALLEGKSKTGPIGANEKSARFAVQAAAPASETAARDLAERL